MAQDLEVVDFTRGLTNEQKEKIIPIGIIPSELIAAAQTVFKRDEQDGNFQYPDLEADKSSSAPEACTIYEHSDFPGQYLDAGSESHDMTK